MSQLIDELETRYADLPDVIAYLETVQQDIVENAEEFLPSQAAQDPASALRRGLTEAHFFRRYRVNVLVDHSGTRGAPVVYEDHPTHPNLVGSIEHISQLGTLVTDFNLIKAGGLHRANGGYLIIDARRILLAAVRLGGAQARAALPPDPHRVAGPEPRLTTTVSLEPEPIPLDLKVVLIGDRLLYYLLAQYDPDLRELFKVAADFEERVERTPEGEALYARLLGNLAEEGRAARPRPHGRGPRHRARLAARRGRREAVAPRSRTSATCCARPTTSPAKAEREAICARGRRARHRRPHPPGRPRRASASRRRSAAAPS